MTRDLLMERVCIVGSGNWYSKWMRSLLYYRGTCIAKIVGENVARLATEHPNTWSPAVRMWVYEEVYNEKKLSEIINETRENPKYLPGCILPPSVLAVPDLSRAVEGATLLVFVIPHQFVEGVCAQIKGRIGTETRAISLIKGLDSSKGGLELISSLISRTLDIDVGVLMGANLANDIAQERFSEATIGFSDHKNAAVWKDLFHTSYFHISLVEDVAGVELCGALKNIVAVAAGFVDGLFPGGNADNTKAAVMRRGLLEMRSLCRLIDSEIRDETFMESCGIADLITSCYGGRNRRVAEAYVRSYPHKSLEQLEAEMLNGQKLQGPPTAKEVFKWLMERELTDRFPLMTAVYLICDEGRDPSHFLLDIAHTRHRS